MRPLAVIVGSVAVACGSHGSSSRPLASDAASDASDAARVAVSSPPLAPNTPPADRRYDLAADLAARLDDAHAEFVGRHRFRPSRGCRNVWKWVADWNRSDGYATFDAHGIARNPRGPADSRDPSEPGVANRVQRGGSFLGSSEYCTRYLVGSRGKGEPSSSSNHLGFRCVAP